VSRIPTGRPQPVHQCLPQAEHLRG
jgi:hypothetical protein